MELAAIFGVVWTMFVILFIFSNNLGTCFIITRMMSLLFWPAAPLTIMSGAGHTSAFSENVLDLARQSDSCFSPVSHSHTATTRHCPEIVVS